MAVSAITNRLLIRSYLNNPQEGSYYTAITNRLLIRSYLNNNLEEVIARMTNRIQMRVYFNNLLEKIEVVVNQMLLKSYASTILSEGEQALGYWQELTTTVKRKRKIFFNSAFSYERDKNK
jgi:hypothetical protein